MVCIKLYLSLHVYKLKKKKVPYTVLLGICVFSMASEETPILVDCEDEYMYLEDDGCLPQFIKRNRFVKYLLAFMCTVLSIGLFYIMLVVLPNIAPEGISIPEIELVKTPDYYLHPLIPVRNSKNGAKDPDDPNKVMPNFKAWEFVSKKDKLFKKHWNQLTKLNRNIKNPKKRVILVGDVHGSLKQLEKLLISFRFDAKSDHVILLGDFIDKGPDSIGVLNYAIKNGLDCVLGNHELEILKRYAQFHAVEAPFFNNQTVAIEESYDLDEMMRIAKRLTPEHITYLSTCSPIQQIGPVPHFKSKSYELPLNGVAVHGGLNWSKKLYQQDPEDVTTIRNLLPPTWEVPTDDRKDKVGGVKSQPWSKIWNQKQEELVDSALKKLKGGELTLGSKVFYGHDAKRGVVSKEYSQGLDSGCVYGKRLTGIMIWSQVDEKGNIVYKHRMNDVNC